MKTIKYISVLLLILIVITITACSPTKGEKQSLHKNYNEKEAAALHLALESCTGTCLTREEMAQLVYNYEKVQSNWNGKQYDNPYDTSVEVTIDLKLETPGEHEHDDNTRYEITILGKDKLGFEQGLKVSIMNNTSSCKMTETSGSKWVLVDTSSETNDDVIKSDNSITFVGEGTEYITQYDNDFDSSSHAQMTFRCAMDELPKELKPGDEIAINITADVISEGEPITNAYMSCSLIVPSIFNPTSDTGANDSAEGIYAGGNTLTDRAFVANMSDCVRFKVPDNKEKKDEIGIYFDTSAGETVWIYQWK